MAQLVQRCHGLRVMKERDRADALKACASTPITLACHPTIPTNNPSARLHRARRQSAHLAPHQVLAQRYRNLGVDLAHALAIEESLPAELGAVVAHPSRSTCGSTFRGTCALREYRDLMSLPSPSI